MMRVADLFAGGGGFSAGAVAAGAELVFAANHWPVAVRTHALNHPTARHECQDLRQFPWHEMPEYDLLLAAPACQGHSSAAQGARKFNERARRKHDALRATAWAVVDCIEVTQPRAVIIENVPAFRRWPKYDLWKMAIERDGYVVSERIIRATACGVPQRRDRLFITATRHAIDIGLPTWDGPEPAIGEVIDWSAGRWRPIESASPAARERIKTARRRFGPRCLSQHVTGHRGIPISEAIRTLTTKDQWVVIDGDAYRPLTVGETFSAMGFADDYLLPEGLTRGDCLKMAGNAVSPPVAEWLFDRVANAA